MDEINHMYSSNEYSQLNKAELNHDESKIREWYAQLEMRYGYGMLQKELGSLEHLIKIYCK